jgi:tetratricopeptide (TPR) repeat protein
MRSLVAAAAVMAFAPLADGGNFDNIPDANNGNQPPVPSVAPNAMQIVVPGPAPGGQPNVAPAAMPDWQTHYHRGYSLLRARQYAAAVDELTQSINLKPAPLTYAFRGEAYANLGKATEAEADMETAMQAVKPNGRMAVNFSCARACLALNEKDKALALLKAAAAAPPKYGPTVNQLAWLLATSPIDAFRDGKKAVELATQACTMSNWKRPGVIDTLAAAYAEAGDFDNAVKTENQCLQLPEVFQGQQEGMQERLELYQAHKPYHDTDKNAPQ